MNRLYRTSQQSERQIVIVTMHVAFARNTLNPSNFFWDHAAAGEDSWMGPGKDAGVLRCFWQVHS